AAGALTGLAAVLRTETLLYAAFLGAALLVFGGEWQAWIRRPKRAVALVAGLAAVLVANGAVERAVLSSGLRDTPPGSNVAATGRRRRCDGRRAVSGAVRIDGPRLVRPWLLSSSPRVSGGGDRSGQGPTVGDRRRRCCRGSRCVAAAMAGPTPAPVGRAIRTPVRCPAHGRGRRRPRAARTHARGRRPRRNGARRRRVQRRLARPAHARRGSGSGLDRARATRRRCRLPPRPSRSRGRSVVRAKPLAQRSR